jgi:hypothetical protein
MNNHKLYLESLAKLPIHDRFQKLELIFDDPSSPIGLRTETIDLTPDQVKRVLNLLISDLV